ncbi:MAG: PRC-barrel domain-containing protein [Acetobacteraceae bacterium]
MVSALAAAPVLAQGGTSHTTTTTTPAAGSGAAGQTATTRGWMTQPGTDEVLASRIKGLNVYNANNDKLGTVDEMLLDHNGRVRAVVISVGGLMGVGEHRVAVPFKQLQFRDRANATMATNAGARTTTTTTTTTAGTASPTGTTATAPALAGPAAGAPTGTAATDTRETRVNTARVDNVPDRAVLNMTVDQLKSAPEFHYNKS